MGQRIRQNVRNAKWIGEEKGGPWGGDAEPAGVRRGAMNGIREHSSFHCGSALP